MDSNQLKELAEKLQNQRSLCDELKAQMDKEKMKKDEIQQNLLFALESTGFMSIKTKNASYSMSTRMTPTITDNEALMADLSQRGLLDELMVSKMDTTRFQTTAKSMLKETGELFAGTEIKETNYISIRTIK